MPVDRAQVLAAAPEIERLIALLRDQERPLREDGMTLARAHLVDRDSPLFERAARGTLRRRVRVVCEAVE